MIGSGLPGLWDLAAIIRAKANVMGHMQPAQSPQKAETVQRDGPVSNEEAELRRRHHTAPNHCRKSLTWLTGARYLTERTPPLLAHVYICQVGRRVLL